MEVLFQGLNTPYDQLGKGLVYNIFIYVFLYLRCFVALFWFECTYTVLPFGVIINVITSHC